MSGVYWGLAGSIGTQGPEGYRWHKGALGAPRGCRGIKGLLGGARGCQGALGMLGVYWELTRSVGT